MLSNQIPPDKSVGEVLRDLRKERGMLLREVAGRLDIDVAILSKMERGERRLTRHHVEQLAGTYGVDPEPLLIMLLRDAVLYEIGQESRAHEILHAAEQQLVYRRKVPDERQKIIDKLNAYFNQNKLVKAAWVFGSFARNEMTPESDIDVMVRFAQNQSVNLMDLAEIMSELEDLTGRRIDLVEEGQLAPYALKTATPNLIRIYG